MKIQRIFRGLFFLGVAASLTLPALQAFPASPARALPQTPDKKMMHDRFQEAVNELNLTDDQKAKLKPLFADAKSKRESIVSDSSLSSDQKKDKMKTLREDTMSKVNDVLTPDQRTQLKEKLEAAKKAPDANYPH